MISKICCHLDNRTAVCSTNQCRGKLVETRIKQKKQAAKQRKLHQKKSHSTIHYIAVLKSTNVIIEGESKKR